MQIYNTEGTFEATAETPCALRVRFNATPDTHTHTHSLTCRLKTASSSLLAV